MGADAARPVRAGALNQEEEQEVERHLADCLACRQEERGLRETHERLAGVSIAVSSKPPDLKARILGALPSRGGAQDVTSAETVRDGRGLLSPVSRTLVVAVLLSILSVGLAVAYWAGAFERPELTATLAPGAS